MRVVPSKAEEAFGLHFLHDGVPFEVLIARIRDLATRDLTRHERAIEFHAEPLAELTVIRQRAPDARNGGFEFDALLNTVVHLRQPPGCILAWCGAKRTLWLHFSGDDPTASQNRGQLPHP